MWDPSINTTDVEVNADNGTITLSGSIGSYTELYAAERDARRVRGVVSVVDELEVRLPPTYKRTDADLAGAANDALRWNALVPSEGISVTADDGRVTLMGEAEYQYQRLAAYDAVRLLIGVKSVNNQIRITPRVSTDEVQARIEQALVRNAETDARNISVEAEAGTVTLRGVVHSWAENDAAVQVAWAAPGVREVENELSVIA